MARPKFEKKSLFEHPLAASSSSSEDEEVEEEEEQKGSAVKKPKSCSKTPHSPSPSPSDDDEEEEEEEDASSEESDSKQATPPKQKLFVSKPKENDPKTPSSSDDEEEEEEDDEPPLLKVKSIASSKPKKTVSSVTPLKSFSKVKKRPFESEKDSKKKKKKKQKVDEEEVEEDEEVSLMNNTPFQRIWSDEDEIVILKGMIESKNNGVDPLSELKEFLESIKKSLTVKEVRQEQLKNKIKRLRKKFMNNSKRAKGGEDPVFSKPHEQLSYTLMKEIWGGRNSVLVADGKDDNDDSVVVVNVKRSSSRLWNSQNAAGNPLRTKKTTFPGISMMELDGSNEDLKQKWRSLIADELKLYLRRVELVREQTIAILDAHKSSEVSEHE